VHPVSIARSFAIGKYEITVEQYDAFAQATGREKPDDMGWGRGTRPVVNVSWDDAAAYATWLSAQTGKHYRLPSEAEWEYSARAGSVTRFTWGDKLGVSKETSATWAGAFTGQGGTAPVGSFAANAFGLHDVHGNAMEWVQDCFEPDYRGAPVDGTSREQCASKMRVLRGGSWFDLDFAMRSASRVAEEPSTPYDSYGFRLARDLGR
jgi:formylglycine-generating enzyme required for sulfatase activity